MNNRLKQIIFGILDDYNQNNNVDPTLMKELDNYMNSLYNRDSEVEEDDSYVAYLAHRFNLSREEAAEAENILVSMQQNDEL